MIIDRADLDNPKNYPEGVRYGLVNGQVVADSGDPADALVGCMSANSKCGNAGIWDRGLMK
jgi:hypothetical protein